MRISVSEIYLCNRQTWVIVWPSLSFQLVKMFTFRCAPVGKPGQPSLSSAETIDVAFSFRSCSGSLFFVLPRFEEEEHEEDFGSHIERVSKDDALKVN